MNSERKMDGRLNGKDIRKKGERNKCTKNGENKSKKNILPVDVPFILFLPPCVSVQSS